MTLPADADADAGPDAGPANGPDLEIRDEGRVLPPVRRPPRQPWRSLLLRLHFYAGILVAPFLAVAALTGLAYVFSPQADHLVYGHELHAGAAGHPELPLARQIAAARAVHPEGTIAKIIPAPTEADTTRVVLDVEGLGTDRQRTVFVDPYTAEVRGALTTWFDYTPLRTWLDDFHRNLHLGDVGRVYSEVAASWLWVVVLGGLVLWWQRLRRPTRDPRGSWERALTPNLTARKGVRRTRGWHAATGVWLAVGLLGLSATGLTWSRWAGGNFGEVLDALDARRPTVESTMKDEHHGDQAAPGSGGGPAETVQETEVIDRADAVRAAAASAGVEVDLELTPPADASHGWVVTENDATWAVHRDSAAIDPATGAVLGVTRYADWPFLARLTGFGVAAHMGTSFGLLNQVLLAALAIGLMCVIVWGYRMWWQRRPAGTRFSTGPAPKAVAWPTFPRASVIVAVALTAAVGWFLPVLGVTLVGFVAVDVVVRRWGRRGKGTTPVPPPART
ncbi:PepSY domain-containing protein [Kineosporia mesophila]|uniref:PepSY domain-containing protein n=1 Tax=Kineosporia mesophila TaxID=566012 RepID=A0ABP6Z886_9ACTN|nr:PepSY-associated TM helix domain-containing protein [Kineosporia mesophila]MCD5353028.1 PepSY domain-containing protein [Kineosporia mesophila]